MKKNPNPERLTQSALCGPVGAKGTSQFLLIRLIWLFGAFSNSGEYGTNPLLRWIPGVFITPGTYHFFNETFRLSHMYDFSFQAYLAILEMILFALLQTVVFVVKMDYALVQMIKFF